MGLAGGLVDSPVEMKTRNFFHVRVQGQTSKLLPCYLHFERDYLKWAKNNDEIILSAMESVIAENIEVNNMESIFFSFTYFIFFFFSPGNRISIKNRGTWSF